MSYIKLIASQDDTQRFAMQQQRGAWLAVQSPKMDIDDQLANLKNTLPKALYLTNKINDIIRSVYADGLSVKLYDEAVALLPDVNMSIEAKNLPSKGDIHHPDTNAFISDIIKSNGVLAKLYELGLEDDLSDILITTERKQAVDMFIKAHDVYRSCIKIGYEIGENYPVSKLQDLFENDPAIDSLGKLLGLLGITYTGYIKTDLKSTSSESAKIALMKMNAGIRNTLKDYAKNIDYVSGGITQLDDKLESLIINLKQIKSLTKTINVLNNTIGNWDNLHIKVAKLMTS